eukprot:3578956-Pleurochrysis_carterae.AAC.1
MAGHRVCSRPGSVPPCCLWPAGPTAAGRGGVAHRDGGSAFHSARAAQAGSRECSAGQHPSQPGGGLAVQLVDP